MAALYTSSISSICFSPEIYPRTASSISCFSPKISPIQTRRIRIAAKPAPKPLIVSSTCGTSFKNNHDPTKSLVQKEDNDLNWRILKRWDVPWSWQTIAFTSLACCGLSPYSELLVSEATLHYTGINVEKLSLDQTAQLFLFNNSIATIVTLGALYSLTKSFTPLNDDIYRFDWREPFDRKKGWLLWAGVALCVTLVAIVAVEALDTFFYPLTETETHPVAALLPLMGSSSISTACMLGAMGVIGPILEETVMRGFFMVSLTKWLPTPLAVLISTCLFTLTHHNHGNPLTFVAGIILGLCYARTRNLLTPITVHVFWNSALVLIMTFLKSLGSPRGPASSPEGRGNDSAHE